MPCPKHRGELAAVLILVDGLGRERPDPLAPGKGERVIERPVANLIQRAFGIRSADARGVQRDGDPALAIAAPRERGAFHLGVAAIVDITEFGEARRDLRYLDRLSLPAAFADLAAKVIAQFALCGREPLNIAERQRFQRGTIKRRWYSAFPASVRRRCVVTAVRALVPARPALPCVHALIVPH